MAEKEFSPDEQAEQLHQEFARSLEIADAVKDARAVRTVEREQAGEKILVAKCPFCGTVAALSGAGRHLCRGCHNWLLYTQE